MGRGPLGLAAREIIPKKRKRPESWKWAGGGETGPSRPEALAGRSVRAAGDPDGGGGGLRRRAAADTPERRSRGRLAREKWGRGSGGRGEPSPGVGDGKRWPERRHCAAAGAAERDAEGRNGTEEGDSPREKAAEPRGGSAAMENDGGDGWRRPRRRSPGSGKTKRGAAALRDPGGDG
jgi:hypothetical protein